MSSFEKQRELFVYHYEHLDDLRFVRRPEEIYTDMDPDALGQRKSAVRAALLTAGWEGDGDLGLIWLPPFVDVGEEDTWGTYVWHVKQSNNGTSWIVSECPLTFMRLEEQNRLSPWGRSGPT
jgi:hypothetical protein